MKPPYVKITATCSVHGPFQVTRKPNPRRDVGAGRVGMYDAVKCPRCPFWATITSQVMVTADPAAPGADQTAEMTLPGMD